MLNKKEIKKDFNNQNMRIGKEVIKKFIKVEEFKIKEDIEKLVRELRISGRKNIKESDLSILN